jgi:hypothetical protein
VDIDLSVSRFNPAGPVCYQRLADKYFNITGDLVDLDLLAASYGHTNTCLLSRCWLHSRLSLL